MAALWGVSKTSVIRWVNDGLIEGVEQWAGRPLIPADASRPYRVGNQLVRAEGAVWRVYVIGSTGLIPYATVTTQGDAVDLADRMRREK